MLNQPFALWDNVDLKSSLRSKFLSVKNNVCLITNTYLDEFSETYPQAQSIPHSSLQRQNPLAVT